MKLNTLFVCFFVALNFNVPFNFETEIRDVENKLDKVNETEAIELSQKCQQLNISLESSCQRLEKRDSKLAKEKNDAFYKYKFEKKKHKNFLIKYGSKIKALQNSNDFIDSLAICRKLDESCSKLNLKYKKYILKKDSYQKNNTLLKRHEKWKSRLDDCQIQLFKRYKNLRGLKNIDDEYSQENQISGNKNLPSYGSIEEFENNGLSCLSGDYQLDSVSSSWKFPVENGTISAYTWSYPDGGLHLGLDVASSLYSKVYACSNGIILYADACVDSNNGYLGNWCGWPNGGGNTICMVAAQEDGLYAVTYAHLSNEIYVGSGQQVSQGDVLALSGNSGNSSGPHTHIEIFRLKEDLNTIVEYFKENADFSFGCGWDAPATCSEYACRIEPTEVLEDV